MRIDTHFQGEHPDRMLNRSSSRKQQLATAMPRQRYLYPKRSDGVASIKKGSTTETNIPSDDQLRQTQNAGIYVWYEEILPSNPKHLDWRKKLGGLLIMRVHDIMDKKGQHFDEPDPEEYVLYELPEHYRLFEHCRQQDLTTPGAGGTRDRRDMYLYGHPDGRKKRFRSPGEFLPHLEWLSMDATRDPANCKCKLCTSDEMVRAGVELAKMMETDFSVTPNFAKEQDTAKATTSAKSATKKKDKSATKEAKETKEVKESKEKVKSSTSASTSTIVAAVTSVYVPPQDKVFPSPLPPIRHKEQGVDLQWAGPFFRVGEIVWFLQPKTLALALGVILFRDQYGPDGKHRNFVIQPFGAPNKPEEQVQVQEDHLFPWLAYSTPEPNNKEIAKKDLTYDTIDWSQLPTNDNLVVDASIFAALAVDNTFTLVQQLTDPAAQTMEFEYNGMYLGGELIWVGDAVRYQANLAEARNEDEILVVHKIVQRVHTGSKPFEYWIVGDVYVRRESNAPEPPSMNLPTRIRNDTQYIQNLQKSAGRSALSLVYKQGSVRAPLNHINGRLYETKTLMEFLRSEELDNALKTGNFPPGTIYLNARANQIPLPSGSPGVRHNTRIRAFSKSVPKTAQLQINFGEEPPVIDQGTIDAENDIAAWMQTQQGYHMAPSANHHSDEQFIQMDQMDQTGYGTMY